MRIAWFTPLSDGSAIAEYSIQLCAELTKSLEVVIWAADEGEGSEAGVPVVDYRPDRFDARLREYEFLIYNFGEDAVHETIFDVSRRHPGICVLHAMYHSLSGIHSSGSSLAKVIAGAEGVLVHADDHAEALERQWLGPVGTVHAPVYAQSWTVERAAGEILGFFDTVKSWRPVLGISRKITEELGHFRASPTAPVVSRVAMELAPLLRR